VAPSAKPLTVSRLPALRLSAADELAPPRVSVDGVVIVRLPAVVVALAKVSAEGEMMVADCAERVTAPVEVSVSARGAPLERRKVVPPEVRAGTGLATAAQTL